jgi:hypothetical protein
MDEDFEVIDLEGQEIPSYNHKTGKHCLQSHSTSRLHPKLASTPVPTPDSKTLPQPITLAELLAAKPLGQPPFQPISAPPPLPTTTNQVPPSTQPIAQTAGARLPAADFENTFEGIVFTKRMLCLR